MILATVVAYKLRDKIDRHTHFILSPETRLVDSRIERNWWNMSKKKGTVFLIHQIMENI